MNTSYRLECLNIDNVQVLRTKVKSIRQAKAKVENGSYRSATIFKGNRPIHEYFYMGKEWTRVSN